MIAALVIILGAMWALGKLAEASGFAALGWFLFLLALAGGGLLLH